MNGRLLGYLNWKAGRNTFHLRRVIDKLTDDLRVHKPDHIAVTGDLTNISLPLEFEHAANWLRELGPPTHVSVVPGNHDAYIDMPHEESLAHWSDYMASDERGTGLVTPTQDGFPFVRVVGDIALIGLSSACPALPFLATGRLKDPQLRALEETLKRLEDQDLFKLIMVHHPPLPSMGDWRRGLLDAEALEGVLERGGADLVIHGHNHRHSHVVLEGPKGPIPIIGAPSASVGREGLWPLGTYYLYEIARGEDGWDCELVSRGLTSPEGEVQELDRVKLTG